MKDLSELEARYATEIIKYRALLEQGALTDDEYQELVQDFLDIDRIRKQLKTEEQKIAAEKVLKGLISLAGILPK
jgi:hypothetical protein